MILTDTHAHLYLDKFAEDREQVLQQAFDAEVKRIFLPNIDRGTISQMKELVAMYPDRLFPMMGLHPCSVEDDFEAQLTAIEKELKRGGYYAVGEIGIDLYWEKKYRSQQEEAFRRQINWAKELNLPIVIHARDSFDEIFQIVDEMNDDRLTGIFHCFTGTLEQANHILNYGGFALGIGGVVTFKNSGLDKVVKELNLDDLVVETDAPYLAPTPYRGKRNETSYVKIVTQKIADIHETSLEKVAEITTANSKRIFNI